MSPLLALASFAVPATGFLAPSSMINPGQEQVYVALVLFGLIAGSLAIVAGLVELIRFAQNPVRPTRLIYAVLGLVLGTFFACGNAYVLAFYTSCQGNSSC